MAVVSNSSPLILFAKIGRLHLLHQLFGAVLIPPAVHDEFVRRGAGRVGAAEVRGADWIEVHALAAPVTESSYQQVLARAGELTRW